MVNVSSWFIGHIKIFISLELKKMESNFNIGTEKVYPVNIFSMIDKQWRASHID